jgi:hypothetical protein
VLLYADEVGEIYSFLATDALTAGRVKVALARYEKAIEILDGLARKGYGPARFFTTLKSIGQGRWSYRVTTVKPSSQRRNWPPGMT